jgi:KDO2-lipid IV(A) lauroyltransferase
MKLAVTFGNIFHANFRRYRKVADECLQLAFKEKYDDKDRQRIVKSSGIYLMKTMLDFIRFGNMSKEEILALAPEVNGKEHLEAAFEKSDGGVIGLTGHIGSWEYCGVWVVASGWHLAAVGKEQRDPGVTKMMIDAREQTGINHISRTKQGNREIIKALKRKNWMLGLISDQNGGKDGVYVDFFGIKASSIRGPAFLALRYGIPVVPIFAIWEGDNYRMEIMPEVNLTRSGDEEKDIVENTQRFQKILERMVEKYPEQWLWAHRRWKTRPEGEPMIHKW